MRVGFLGGWSVCFFRDVAGAGGVLRGESERGEVAAILLVVDAGTADARVLPVWKIGGIGSFAHAKVGFWRFLCRFGCAKVGFIGVCAALSILFCLAFRILGLRLFRRSGVGPRKTGLRLNG